MKGFILSLRSEFYKNRKTLGFWGAIVLPVIIVTGIFIGFLTHSDNLAKTPGMLLWLNYTGVISGLMGNLLLPFLIVFMAYSANSIEHKADTWKTLFTLPISKWSVYAAKYFYTVFLVFMCLFLFCTLLIASGNLLGMLSPDLHFHDYSIASYLFEVYTKLFFAGLGIVSIQFLLSLVWGDFLKPMGIGFVGIIAGWISFGTQWKYNYLIPYAHPSLALHNLMDNARQVKVKGAPANAMPHFDIDIFTREVWVSLAFAAAVFVAGFFIVQRKSVK